MSRAVVYWPLPGSPCGLMKRVEIMPILCAVAFISATKASSLPDTASAIATATSLADLTSKYLSAESSGNRSPGLKYILLAGSLAASIDMVTGVSMVI